MAQLLEILLFVIIFMNVHGNTYVFLVKTGERSIRPGKLTPVTKLTFRTNRTLSSFAANKNCGRMTEVATSFSANIGRRVRYLLVY